jgi:hypothetical protein
MNATSVSTEQVSNRRTRNNRNCNNQTAASMQTEQVSVKNFYYEELTPYQMVVLHQER